MCIRPVQKRRLPVYMVNTHTSLAGGEASGTAVKHDTAWILQGRAPSSYSELSLSSPDMCLHGLGLLKVWGGL